MLARPPLDDDSWAVFLLYRHKTPKNGPTAGFSWKNPKIDPIFINFRKFSYWKSH